MGSLTFVYPPDHWRKSELARMEIYCPVWLPALAPEEFIIDPVAPCGGMLEPWPMPLSPISASAVCSTQLLQSTSPKFLHLRS